MLAHWAGFYKSLFEMSPEHKPDDDMIDDDELLDRWYEAFVREQARKASRRGGTRVDKAPSWRPE